MAATPSDLDAPLALLFASLMSGLVVTNARVGIHHGVGHSPGAHLGLAHALANAVLLPHALEFNLEATAEQQAQAAAAMGLDCRGLSAMDAARAAGARRIRRAQAAIGVPRRLRDLPGPPRRDDLRPVARETMRDRALYFNPRPIAGEAAVLALLEAAW